MSICKDLTFLDGIKCDQFHTITTQFFNSCFPGIKTWLLNRFYDESNGSNVYEVASWNFVETLGANEYVQLMWGSADLNAQIVAIPSASTTMGIDVPSVIVTVTPVGA